MLATSGDIPLARAISRSTEPRLKSPPPPICSRTSRACLWCDARDVTDVTGYLFSTYRNKDSKYTYVINRESVTSVTLCRLCGQGAQPKQHGFPAFWSIVPTLAGSVEGGHRSPMAVTSRQGDVHGPKSEQRFAFTGEPRQVISKLHSDPLRRGIIVIENAFARAGPRRDAARLGADFACP